MSFACASLLAACHTDTSGLEKHQPGAPPDDGAGGSTAGTASQEPSSADDPEHVPAAQAQSGSLAFLHGLVDGGRLYVCLRDLVTDRALVGSPEPAEGLEFGRFQRRGLDWDVSSVDVEVELFAAPSPLDGQSCESLRQSAAPAALPRALDAAPDAGRTPAGVPAGPRRAGSLTLARGSLFEGRHYLLVATGCAAPESLVSPESCGPPDPFFGARTELVLVEFGAELTQGGRSFGLQFLNASRALGPADLSLQLDGPNDLSVPFVSGVSFGVLRPLAVATVEEPLALELHGRGTSSGLAHTQSWAETLETSAPPQFAPGKNYVLASIGPTPRDDGAGSSLPRLVLVPAE
ncbi:MAG: hypothetical protein ABI895_22075 [Deltaproteobacteria bacterium]